MALTQITSDVISAGAISTTMIANGSITSAHIVSVSNTAITGNIISSQITSVSNTQLTGVVTSNQLASSAQYMGFKNRIINGDFRIDQRNAGASVTPTTSGYTLDRCQGLLTVSSKYSVQQNAGSVTPPVGFSNYLGVISLSAYSVGASDFFGVAQGIEGFNWADLNWGTANAKTVTLSFWVRSSLTGTFSGSFYNSGFSYSYPFSYTISSANTWEFETVTIAGPTAGTWLGATNGTGAKVAFSLGTGSTYSGTAGSWSANSYLGTTGAVSVVGTNGATFYITGVQLEVGSQATSFDFRSIGQETALCQRYYWRNTVLASTSASITSCSYPVPMRTTPSLVVVSIGFGSGALFSANGSTASNSLANQYFYQSTVNSTVSNCVIETSGAEL